MSYLGNTPTTQNFISGTDYFNGTGAQTAFTLSRTVNSVNDIQVTVNNVVQQPNDAYTLSGTTLTMTSAPSAGTNNVYVRYLSTTTQVITPSQNTVSWNTLDSNIQQDLGVMYKNRIINGNMVINQRGGTVNASSSGAYGVDRFVSFANGGGAFTAVQSSTVPTGQGFVNSNLLTVTTPDSSIVSGDYYSYYQPIEGLNTADFMWGTANAKTVTLSFWVNSSVTGLYAVALLNNDGSRCYPATFTITNSNTWQKITLTVAGCTDGTWLTNTSTGVGVRWDLGSGSNNNGTANTWNTAGSFAGVRTSSTVNWIATNGATFYLTGVQLEVGTQATAFSTAGGSYGAELALCQRYFESNFPIGTAPSNGGAVSDRVACAIFFDKSVGTQFTFKTSKRATPTITFYSGANNTSVNGQPCVYIGTTWTTVPTPSITGNTNSYEFGFQSASVSTATNNAAVIGQIPWIASAEL